MREDYKEVLDPRPQNDPETCESHQNDPETRESHQNDPETDENHQNDPETDEYHQNDPRNQFGGILVGSKGHFNIMLKWPFDPTRIPPN